MNISDTVAVITGGASGIGAAVANTLAQAGSKVVLGDVNEEQLEQVAESISIAGGEVAAQKIDVRQEAEVASLMDLAIERFGRINVVLPSAGIFRDAFMISLSKEGKVAKFMSTEQFKAVIDINLLGSFLTIREAAMRMVDNGWPGVIFTVSSINKAGELGQLNYSSSKAAVALWPKILVGEFHARGISGIRVVGIAPGYVETPILKGMRPDVLENLLKNVPLNRLIRIDEIASLIAQVIENEAINGTTIEIAGGVISRGLVK